MSFTASVKDELSHINATCPHCDYALLSGIVRICGSLSLKGSTTSHSRYSVTIATETGVVARMIINLTHTLFDLDTYLTVRHSNLHIKTVCQHFCIRSKFWMPLVHYAQAFLKSFYSERVARRHFCVDVLLQAVL